MGTALLGALPSRVKFGDNELAYAQLTRERIVGELQHDSLTESRRAVSDLVLRTNEGALSKGKQLPAVGTVLGIIAYKAAIHMALQRALPEATSIDQFGDEDAGGRGTDFRLFLGGREILVGIGYRASGRPMPGAVLQMFQEEAAAVDRLLVVTNRPPSDYYRLVHSQGRMNLFSEAALPANMTIVKWETGADDVALRNAVLSFLSTDVAGSNSPS
ncbi:MAG TPA: hypothetical protein VLJ59_12930 [Mycobacteriales bacterium]|nr:hypothetical protein [Mycobacteriales bacterium]